MSINKSAAKSGLKTGIACHYCHSEQHVSLKCPNATDEAGGETKSRPFQFDKRQKKDRFQARRAEGGARFGELRRDEKSRPQEISSKVKPAFLRRVVQVKNNSFRDPRFDDLSGLFIQRQFDSSYGFINDIEKDEKEGVKAIIRDNTLDEETRARAKDLLQRMKQKAKSNVDTAEESVDRKLKEERKANMKNGLGPYFPKRGEKKKLVLAEKYKELKEKGKLVNYMRGKQKNLDRKSRRDKPSTAERTNNAADFS